MLLIVALGVVMGGVLCAQDFTGNWQGTLKDHKDLRLILVVSKDGGRLQAKIGESHGKIATAGTAERARAAGQGHDFQGALLLSQRAFRLILSRSVSIGCQNP